MTLTPAPLVATFSCNAIGNLTYKSDVGSYSYPAPGEPRPHGRLLHLGRGDQHHLQRSLSSGRR